MKRHLFTILLTSTLVATLHAQLDTNNNGMSDIWERYYNNGELFDASITAAGDEDGDGQSNAAESLAGTNPFSFHVPNGYFAAQVRHVPETWSQGPSDPEPILENPEAYEISWFGVAGKKYILQGSEDLSNWIDITTRYGYDFLITEACLPQDENHESLPRFFWRVKVEDILSEEGILTEHERYRLGFDADPVDHLNAIPEAWFATHYAAKLMNWGGPDALSLNDDPNQTGYTIAEQFAHGIGPTDDAPPGGRRWVIEVGDRGENITVPRNGTLKLGPNQSAVLLVAIASREYPEWTGPGTAKKYNDHFDWEVTYDGQPKFQGSADINDYHQELENAEGQSFQIPGLPHPSYILDVEVVTNESDKEIEIGIEASVTNIGDSTLPSTLAIGLLPIDLAVDANRNGEVEFGIDQTSSAVPYRFWVNNDSDTEEDEENPGGGQPDHADNSILTQRDLEDFARIQLMVGGLHEQLKSGEIQVTMKFKEGTVEGNPALNLWLHLDEDGVRDYLLDEQVAARHLALANPGRVTASSGYTFQPGFWTGEGIPNYPAITSEKPYRYLLFEGASKGKGELVLEFKNGSEVLGEGCSCWINLLDVRNMYQRAKVTPDHPDDFTEPSDFVGVSFNPTITPPVPEIGWTWDPNGEAFIEDPSEEQQYLVFVHGWRMTYDGSQKYAESMFKRLWQTGYKGRFAFVRWPTYSEDTHPATNGLFTYNASDYRAWLSGKGVAAFVNSLPSSHVRNITAHSMGNVVVSSALREGMQVDNYALLNAAIPAMCYDGNNALYEFERETPDGDADPITKDLGFEEKITGDNVRRGVINFYLENDSALTGMINVPWIGEVGGWEDNNKNYKPETWGITGYKYDPERTAGTKVYIDFLTEFGRHLRSFYESAAYATASRTKAVGADGRTAGAINDKVNMDAQYGFGTTHSAEWLWRIQKTDRFYHDLMEKFEINPIP